MIFKTVANNSPYNVTDPNWTDARTLIQRNEVTYSVGHQTRGIHIRSGNSFCESGNSRAKIIRPLAEAVQNCLQLIPSTPDGPEDPSV